MTSDLNPTQAGRLAGASGETIGRGGVKNADHRKDATMTLRKTRRRLYSAPRVRGDVDPARGPRKVVRRAKNRLLGKALGKAGICRRLRG